MRSAVIICYNSYSANTKVYSKVGSLYDLQGFIISCYTTVASIYTNQNMFLLIRPDEDQSVLYLWAPLPVDRNITEMYFILFILPQFVENWVFIESSGVVFLNKLNIILYIWVLICIYFLFLCLFFPIYWFQMIYFANYLGFKVYTGDVEDSNAHVWNMIH